MRNLIILFVLFSALVSCKNRQEPSQRIPVWGNSSRQLEVTMDAPNVQVPFKRTNGDLAEVQVSLNGVPFNMWWDTGASMMSISSLEFTKMIKEGKVDKDDYAGKVSFTMADGSIEECDVYYIKEVFIKGINDKYLRIHNVKMSISDSPDAPLLIGQNVMQALPRHTFNDDTGMIEFGRNEF